MNDAGGLKKHAAGSKTSIVSSSSRYDTGKALETARRTEVCSRHGAVFGVRKLAYGAIVQQGSAMPERRRQGHTKQQEDKARCSQRRVELAQPLDAPLAIGIRAALYRLLLIWSRNLFCRRVLDRQTYHSTLYSDALVARRVPDSQKTPSQPSGTRVSKRGKTLIRNVSSSCGHGYHRVLA